MSSSDLTPFSRFRHPLVLSLVTALVLVAVAALPGARTALAGERAPDTLELQLLGPTLSVTGSEPIRFTFALQNLGGKAVSLADPTLVPGPTVPAEEFGLRLEVVDPQKRPTTLVRQDLFAAYIPFGSKYRRLLQPGDSIQGTIALGNQPFEHSQWVVHRPNESVITEAEMRVLDNVFGKPGRYSVRAVYLQSHQRLPGGLSPAPEESPEVWSGRLESPWIEFEVAP